LCLYVRYAQQFASQTALRGSISFDSTTPGQEDKSMKLIQRIFGRRTSPKSSGVHEYSITASDEEESANHIRFRWLNISVEFDMTTVVNYSLVHCGLPLVYSLSAHNEGKSSSQPIELELVIPGYGDSHLSIPPICSGETLILENPNFNFDSSAFEAQIDRRRSKLEVRINKKTILSTELWVLAYNEWSCEPEHRLAGASFVQPDHPLIQNLEAEASQHLKKSTGEDSFHTVLHSESPNSVERIVESFYECLKTDWHFHYTYEPPSFQPSSQKVRLPHHVLDLSSHCGEGTCIDLVLLMAACLEHVDQERLRPTVIIVKTGQNSQHALLGFWCEQIGSDDKPLLTEKDWLDYCLKSKRLFLLECVGFAEGYDDYGEKLGFQEAINKAESCLYNNTFLYAVDIVAARWDKNITPLPFAGEPQWASDAHDALREAESCARQTQTKFLGTIHLLAGLLNIEGGMTRQIFKSLDISPDDARENLEKDLRALGHKAEEFKPTKNYKYNIPRIAKDRAKRDGSPLILEAHLFFALFDASSGSFDKALASVHTSREQCKEQFKQFCIAEGFKSSWTSSQFLYEKTPSMNF